jgi:hypothetical protein
MSPTRAKPSTEAPPAGWADVEARLAAGHWPTAHMLADAVRAGGVPPAYRRLVAAWLEGERPPKPRGRPPKPFLDHVKGYTPPGWPKDWRKSSKSVPRHAHRGRFLPDGDQQHDPEWDTKDLYQDTFTDDQLVVNLAARVNYLCAMSLHQNGKRNRDDAIAAAAGAYHLSKEGVRLRLKRGLPKLPAEWRDSIPTVKDFLITIRTRENGTKKSPD